MADRDLFDFLSHFVDLGANTSGTGISLSTEGKAKIDLEPGWIARSVAVGIAQQARSNLRATKGPDGTPLPPLKQARLQVSKSGKRLTHAKRGIDTGLLMRSIVSANQGDGAVVFVRGERGSPTAYPGGVDKSAADTTFLDTFRANLDQPLVQKKMADVAAAIVGELAKSTALADTE